MTARRLTPEEYRAAEGVDQNDPAGGLMSSPEEVIGDLGQRIDRLIPDQLDTEQQDTLIEREGILTDRQLRSVETAAEESTVAGTERQFITMARRGQFFQRTHGDDALAVEFGRRYDRYLHDTHQLEDAPVKAPDYQQQRVQLLIRAHDDLLPLVRALEVKYGRREPTST